MRTAPSFTWWTLLAILLVASCAAGTRVWYLVHCTDFGERSALLQVQGETRRLLLPDGTTYRGQQHPTELDNLVANLSEHQEFKCWAPLSDKEELTAHVAPGYPWLFGMVESWQDSANMVMRWLQCALGVLTVVFFFLFARQAFHSTVTATLTGLLMAVYPFWIINTAELNDGVLTCFLLAASLMFGTRASQAGGAFSGLFFGLALAALVLVRGAMLPFALVALLWFLWRCRRLSMGWYVGLLALVGFANVAPWIVRNYQLFGHPVPVTTTTYFELWVGNNSAADDSTFSEPALRASLAEDRLKQLMAEPNQARRYDMLANEVWNEVNEHLDRTVTRRFQAAFAFFLGDTWVKQKRFVVERTDDPEVAGLPEPVELYANQALGAALLGVFVLSLLGWRFSFAWRVQSRLATIAAIWIPLPYLLSHAEPLSGPRLPFDGILLCYAAFALASGIPGVTRRRDMSPDAEVGKSPKAK